MKIKFLFPVVFIVFLAATALAHEYWLEPETFFPAVNQKTVVHLYVGDGLVKDRAERPFQLAKTEAFQLLSASDSRDLKTSVSDGALPVYNFSADRAGNYLLAMNRDWSFIKLAPQQFEDYLREDGMEYIIAERKRLNESKKEGRERYARFIKSLLQVGDLRDETFKRLVGSKLEIVPLENPYSKKVGDSLNLQILFEGKPLLGRTVFANNRNSKPQKMTTDGEGKFAMKIDHSGLWLVRLVFMQRCASDCKDADWESFWSAFTFGVK